ncbi:MAG: VCBS domain-containing protein, partial [Planctomycetes bacterium]|nr:VCBS domain-containing protein [Planctomycetota bacterium]
MVERVNGPILRNGDGNFVVPIRVSLTNSGAISVASPQIRKLLSSDFGSYFHSVSNISLNTSGVLQGTAPTLDAAFNGSTTTSMLLGGNLAPNDTVVVTMDVVVKNAASVMPNLINPSFFTGTTLNGMPLPYSLDTLAGSQSFTGTFNDTAPAAWDGTFSLNITRVGSGTVTRPSSISMSRPWTYTDDSGNNLVFGESSSASITGSMTAGNPNDYTFNYDFSGLVNGYLPAGTSIWFSDVDNTGNEFVRISGSIAGGTGQLPFLTSLAQSGTGTPAAFSYNSTTGVYSLDAVAANNGLLQGFVTTQNLTSLSIQAPHLDVVNSTGYSLFLAAPSDGTVELSTQARSNNTVNGITITERADTGNTHESSNPGTLGDSGGRSDATRISIPMIEVQQSAATPIRATSGVPGNFDVTFDITVSNAGLNALKNLTLAQNFASQLGGAFVRIVPQGGSPATILSSNAADNPGLNVNYDGGTTNANLFDGSPSQLGLTQSLTLRVVVEINPYAVGAIRDGITSDGNGDFETQSYATAIETRYGATITDQSDNPANAINADANADGNPDDPTGFRPTLPTAAPDILTTAEDTTLSTNVITANGIDRDPNGDTLTIQSATIDLNGDGTQDVLSLGIATPVISNGQSIGVLTLSANGSLIFVPATDYYGNVPRITYVVNDGNGNTDSTTIDIGVTSANDAPTAVVDTATAVEAGGTANGTAGTNPTGNVLTNDTDVDAGDTKAVSGVAAGVVGSASTNVGSNVTGTYGSINIAANGSYNYTVDNNNATVQALRTSGNTLQEVFTYTMRDTAGLTSTTQITVTIQGANDAPTIVSNGGGATAAISMAENLTAVTTVIGNDVDAGSTLTYSIVGGADAGKFSIGSSTGSLVFVTAPDFENPTDVGGNNVYDVIVQVSDGSLATTQALAVTITDVSNILVVTTTADNNDALLTAGNVAHNVEWLNANRGTDGLISLREAILAANNTSGLDTVNFNIAGSGVQRINLASTLPGITSPIVINGFTQNGASANTLAVGSNAVINVEINGSALGAGGIGFNFIAGSGGSTLQGLSIGGFNNWGIELASGGHTIAGNNIGLRADGVTSFSNTWGIVIGSNNNIIGSANPAGRNTISGNANDGISIDGANNAIVGNYISTNASGSSIVANGRYGVLVNAGATNNFIGGLTAGSGNVIGGSQFGINIGGDANTVAGNIIGLNATGTGTLFNSRGIYVSGADNLIGGTTSAARNVISGNTTGIEINGASANNNSIQGNYIGTNLDGTAGLGNWRGIWITNNATGNTVGGSVSGAGNVISGNSSYGIELASSSNTVAGNTIGLNAAGDTKLANSYGVYINNAGNNTIGGTTTLARNIISGNTNDGVFIGGASATGNFIQGNYIGLGANGTTALGNSGVGIFVFSGSNSNSIGGAIAGAGNVISGNTSFGIRLDSSNNQVAGNIIGLVASGNSAAGNGAKGILVTAQNGGGNDNVIGGTTVLARNVISGNAGEGIQITGSGNLVQGNYIGTDTTGLVALGNFGRGVWVAGGSTNTIGGSAPGAGNLLSGNNIYGIHLSSTANNLVAGNIIGLDVTGSAKLSNNNTG